MIKILVSFLCTLLLACQVIPTKAATVTRLAWADRHEETPPFVRIVLDLDEPVTGECYLLNDGLTVNVVLLDSALLSSVPAMLTVPSKTLHTLSFSRSGQNLIFAAGLNHTIDASRVKIFTLEPDAKAGRPQRLVLDIPAKS